MATCICSLDTYSKLSSRPWARLWEHRDEGQTGLPLGCPGWVGSTNAHLMMYAVWASRVLGVGRNFLREVQPKLL